MKYRKLSSVLSSLVPAVRDLDVCQRFQLNLFDKWEMFNSDIYKVGGGVQGSWWKSQLHPPPITEAVLLHNLFLNLGTAVEVLGSCSMPRTAPGVISCRGDQSHSRHPLWSGLELIPEFVITAARPGASPDTPCHDSLDWSLKPLLVFSASAAKTGASLMSYITAVGPRASPSVILWPRMAFGSSLNYSCR